MNKNQQNITETSENLQDPAPCSTRRLLLQTGLVSIGGFLLDPARLSAAEAAMSPPEHNPAVELAFTIFAEIEGVLNVGETATGQVRAIPITGGDVNGANISGRVIPGGADWQRTRSDGVTEIEATYALELDDKTIIKVVNSGLIVPPATQGAPAYFRTSCKFTAPNGPHQWLNEAIFLTSVGGNPQRPGGVQIDVYKLI